MSRKANIILISPNLKGFSGGINRIVPGLGIGYLAAVLREAGHNVHVRDTAVEGYDQEVALDGKMVLIGESDDSIRDYIADIHPDIVGISALFSNLMAHTHTIARIAKEVDPNIKVIMGGNHIGNAVRDYLFAREHPGLGLPGELVDMLDENIDYAILGEGEAQLLNLVECYMAGQSTDDVEGIVFRRNGQLQINPQARQIVDLNRLPFPARDLMNLEAYFKIGLFHSGKARSNRVLNVMTSRGCPEQCSFCTTPLMWGKQLRVREPGNVFQEIKEGIDKYRISEVQFEDDTLTANRKNLLELCELIEPLGITWCTPNGIKVNYHQNDNRQYEMFKRMADSGCYQVTLACESGVQRVLDDIAHKKLRIEQIAPAVENAKRAGLLAHTFWIVGYPGETRMEMEETVEFAASIGADSYTLSILCPLPGTPIRHLVARKNLYWNQKCIERDIVFRNSLIRIDGFNTPEEFEMWVEDKTLYLNRLLRERNAERFNAHYGRDASDGAMIKQT
jgi:anaerobic magnesium-protoporphyrin IX monomethyl ester cyclase